MKLKQKMRQKFTAVNIYIKKKTEVKPQLSGGRSKRSPEFVTSQVYRVSSRNPVLLLVCIIVFQSAATVTQMHTVNRDGARQTKRFQ